jgi:hypothetical protein
MHIPRIEGLAADHHIQRSAVNSGGGTWLELGGPPDLA